MSGDHWLVQVKRGDEWVTESTHKTWVAATWARDELENPGGVLVRIVGLHSPQDRTRGKTTGEFMTEQQRQDMRDAGRGDQV